MIKYSSLQQRNMIIKLMSSNFLQRFKGKTNIISKEGVHDVIGGSKEEVIVYTNNNFNPKPANKQSGSNKSISKEEKVKENKPSQKYIANENVKIKPNKPQIVKKQVIQPKNENPFLVSNPFYLDEEEKQRQEKQRKERQKQEKEQKLKQKEKQKQSGRKSSYDSKKTTQMSLNRSLDKKRNEKQWVKMGGLGANIGGDDWVEKKKKLDKMQEFSDQVKSINNDRPKIPKPVQKTQKQLNARQKALEYSKKVPKPVVKQAQRLEQTEQKEEPEDSLSELQKYALKHEQLKNILRNQ